jgi:hypothetical protein
VCARWHLWSVRLLLGGARVDLRRIRIRARAGPVQRFSSGRSATAWRTGTKQCPRRLRRRLQRSERIRGPPRRHRRTHRHQRRMGIHSLTAADIADSPHPNLSAALDVPERPAHNRQYGRLDVRGSSAHVRRYVRSTDSHAAKNRRSRACDANGRYQLSTACTFLAAFLVETRFRASERPLCSKGWNRVTRQGPWHVTHLGVRRPCSARAVGGHGMSGSQGVRGSNPLSSTERERRKPR